MERQIVAIYDRKTEAFGQPFFVRHSGEAIRAMQDEVNNKDSTLAKHPTDFELYVIGTFNDVTGDLKQIEHRKLAQAEELIRE